MCICVYLGSSGSSGIASGFDFFGSLAFLEEGLRGRSRSSFGDGTKNKSKVRCQTRKTQDITKRTFKGEKVTAR